MMTLERAHDIVKAINARCFVTMGFGHDLPSLDGVTLGEMVEATAMVRNSNAAAGARAKIIGGSYSTHVVPDDRLIAAVYSMEHYLVSDDPILTLPFNSTDLRVLVIARVPAAQLECAE